MSFTPWCESDACFPEAEAGAIVTVSMGSHAQSTEIRRCDSGGAWMDRRGFIIGYGVQTIGSDVARNTPALYSSVACHGGDLDDA